MVDENNGQSQQRQTVEQIKDYVKKCLSKEKPEAPKSGPMIEIMVKGIEEHTNFFCIQETDELIFYDASRSRYVPEGSKKVHGFSESVIRNANVMAYLHNNPITEIEGHVRRHSFVRLEEFENEELFYIPLKNGIYDLQDKTLIPYSHEYRFLNALNVEFNSDAKCPNFEKFLDDICIDSDGHPEPKMRKTLIQLFAYCLWRAYPIQKVFFLIGGGANGKGVLLGTLQAFLGNDNVANRSILSLGDNRFAGADLYRKHANISNELTVEELRSVDLIKSLCSGTDHISAERKFQQPFNFLNYAKIIIATNAPPKTNDATDGFYRRLNLIRFSRQFLGNDDNKALPELLRAPCELSGILNLALREIDEWMVGGKFNPNSDFANVMSIDEVRELYERLADSIAAYRYDVLEITGEEEDVISKDHLFMKYRDYCKSKKIGAATEAKFWRDFRAQTLGSIQDKRVGNNKIRSLSGLKFKEIEEKVSGYPSISPLHAGESESIGVNGEQGVKLDGYLDTNFKFFKPVEVWIGQDMKRYGPFKTGEIVALPKQEAEFLMKNGIGEYI